MQNTKVRIWPWLLLWGIVDLLCALFCEIHADEAYYRLYGQFLDWGYFDHPPMVGLMTATSSALVHGTSLMLKNLSVRLMTVLLHVGTVFTIWKTVSLTDRFTDRPATPDRVQTDLLEKFLLVAASLPMFCAYGFITTPDAPLLFFAAVFYYAYRRYLNQKSGTRSQDIGNTLLLGISMAGMLYSKYMAVLVIGLAVLSNWQLLKDCKAWASVGIASVLLLPHLYWQLSHHWPSFTYHLVSRATAYQPLYSLEFIPNQWAVFNPVVWGLMLWFGARAFRAKDLFKRTLGVTICGFQVFFLLMAFRGHVEPHWTMVTSIPAIILLTEEETIWSRAAWRMALGACVSLILLARVVLMANILPARTGLANKQPYYNALHEQAKGMPIIFDGSFQRPSLYRFYYNDEATLVRSEKDRYTQFDLLHLEQSFMGQPACLMRHGHVQFVSSLTQEDMP